MEVEFKEKRYEPYTFVMKQTRHSFAMAKLGSLSTMNVWRKADVKLLKLKNAY